MLYPLKLKELEDAKQGVSEGQCKYSGEVNNIGRSQTRNILIQQKTQRMTCM